MRSGNSVLQLHWFIASHVIDPENFKAVTRHGRHSLQSLFHPYYVFLLFILILVPLSRFLARQAKSRDQQLTSAVDISLPNQLSTKPSP